jgi:hypothetical protein
VAIRDRREGFVIVRQRVVRHEDLFGHANSADGACCPVCEQPLPPDREAEIASRIAARDEAAAARLSAQLRETHERERQAAVAAAHEAGRRTADAEMTARLAELETERADLVVALKRQASEIAAAREQAAAEARAAVEARFRAEAERQVAARAEAEKALATLRASQAEALDAGLKAQREALEKATIEAVNAERARGFEERLKIEGQVQDLQRRLQNKTAEELGEGGEIDLYEALRKEFPADRITRIAKGAAGPDIVHDILHNGEPCGRIVYDAKNRNAWRNDYVAKLRQDQLSAGADHAVLASRVFPSGARQIMVQDGVIVADPARAVVVAGLLRRQVLQAHALRLSNQSRMEKTEALYAFITSERCHALFEGIATVTGDMESLEQKEKRAHELTWKRRAELIGAITRTRTQLSDEFARIIGTAPPPATPDASPPVPPDALVEDT